MFSDYDDLYEAILNLTEGPEEPEFDALPRAAQALFVAAMLDMEVQNGGVAQFFANCGSPCAILASDSLKEIGLDEMARFYEDFMREHALNLADLSAFECETVEDFVGIYEKYAYLEEFDDKYMQMWEADDFNGHMIAYAEAHSELF